jgi:hypothetical protein
MSGEEYNIPCLAPAQDVYQAFNELRSSWEGARWKKLTSRQINARLNAQVNRYLREEVGSLWPSGVNLSTKCLRALYAEIACKMFAPKEMAKASYFGQILGHGSEDRGTALSYMDYFLDSGDEEAALKERRAIIEEIKDLEHPGEPSETSNVNDDSEVIDENDR